jgi:DNA-directed RNA polymerase specialized sigma subunit
MNNMRAGMSADESLKESQEALLKRAKQRRVQAWKMHRSGLTFVEIGEALGVSRQRASHLVRRAIKDIGR